MFEYNMTLKSAFPFGSVVAEGARELRVFAALVALVLLKVALLSVRSATRAHVPLFCLNLQNYTNRQSYQTEPISIYFTAQYPEIIDVPSTR